MMSNVWRYLLVYVCLCKIIHERFIDRIYRTKNPKAYALRFFNIAEVEGFEPPVPCGTSVFKTGAFDHSATPPLNNAAKVHTRFQIQSNYSLNLLLFNSPLLNDNSYYVKYYVIFISL